MSGTKNRPNHELGLKAETPARAAKKQRTRREEEKEAVQVLQSFIARGEEGDDC